MFCIHASINTMGDSWHTGKTIATLIFIFINTMFVLLSVGIMIAVTYIRGDLQYELWERMPTRKAFSSDEAYDTKEVESLVSIVLNGTMVVAAVIMVIGAIGFITGFTMKTCLLMTYIMITSALYILGCFVYTKFDTEDLVKWAQWKTLQLIRERFVGRYSFEWPSLVINYVMATYKCCGLSDYEDFEKAEKWEREYAVDGKKVKLPIPLACCRVNDDFPRGIPDDVKCTSEPNLANSFQDVGCSTMGEEIVAYYGGPFRYGIIGFCVVQIILILMTLFILIAHQRERYAEHTEVQRVQKGTSMNQRLKGFLKDAELVVG